MYALQEYVAAKMKEKGLKKSDFAKRLGYRNVAKGCRRIDDFFSRTWFHPDFVRRLPSALDRPEEEIGQKIEETRGEIRREEEEERLRRIDFERRTFIPHLFCRTELRVPSPIFICAILGADRMRYAYLPLNYNDIPPEEQERLRREAIMEKMGSTGGEIPSFGRITHFVLRRSYDDVENEREVFDLRGDPVADPDEEQRRVFEGTATLTYRGRDILVLFGLK